MLVRPSAPAEANCVRDAVCAAIVDGRASVPFQRGAYAGLPTTAPRKTTFTQSLSVAT